MVGRRTVQLTIGAVLIIAVGSLVSTAVRGHRLNQSLAAAVQGNTPDVVEDALRAGADPNLRVGGVPLLVTACVQDDPRIETALLDAGADPNTGFFDDEHTPHPERESALYGAAGALAIFSSRPFERRFRDIHTVTQQIQGHPAHFETVGQILLGREPDRPMFTF